MTALNDVAVTSYIDTARLRPHELARQLVQNLGPTLVALIAGVRDRKLPHKWAHSEGPTPRDAALARLQIAHRCWIILATSEDPDVARSWFIGANPTLDEESPALAIRADRFRETIAAAVLFVEGSGH
ncbi:hypothetical protein [Nocardia spumae]|uniref:hypothetical protein n=1 Tax=Nocardia spumae TaxID=2887190 RepID=UPI001D13785D|nr:hypothetical protein [Nocardia spumae]